MAGPQPVSHETECLSSSLPSHFRNAQPYNSLPCALLDAQPWMEEPWGIQQPDLHCWCFVSKEAMGYMLCQLFLAVKS